MSTTVVITSTDIESSKWRSPKRKKEDGGLSESLESLNLKPFKCFSDKKPRLLNSEKKELKPEIKLDFQYNSLSFIRIFSKRLNKDISVQLNMDVDIYSYINDKVREFNKLFDDNPKIKDLERFLQKKLCHRIKKWSQDKKIIYSDSSIKDKGSDLIKEFIRFKKVLIHNSKEKK